MDHVHTCIVGGGVVGLAIARRLTAFSTEVLVVDAEQSIGQGISSRNSEVIHAGLYYPKDTLKAKFCVNGNRQLVAYCSSRQIPMKRCGKLVVATNADEQSVLADVMAKAQDNGVVDLEYLSRQQIGKLEAEVSAELALLSPSTGIVSSHHLMLAYLTDIEKAGGQFVGGTQVHQIEKINDHFKLYCSIAGDPYQFTCRWLVNAAGLGAQTLARTIDAMPESAIPELYLCKGCYFSLTTGTPFKHLVYPVPAPHTAGLGIHATIDLAGQVKFGPDVEYIDELDYSVPAGKAEDYYAAIRTYYPALPDDSLSPGYAGIRPKLQHPQGLPEDFQIQDVSDHGVDGLVQLFGIESPGLTSSMAIADHVYSQFKEYQ